MNGSSPFIGYNKIVGGWGELSYGIYNYGSSSPSILNNLIHGGFGYSNSYGIFNKDHSIPVIRNNTINGGWGYNTSFGIFIQNSPGIIISPRYMALQEPVERDGTTGIVSICLNRNQYDCDYTFMDLNPQDILMPFKGEIEFGLELITLGNKPHPDPVNPDTGEFIRNIDFALSLGDIGGLNTRMAIDDIFWDHPDTQVVLGESGYSKLVWDLTINFGSNLFLHSLDVNFFVSISVPVQSSQPLPVPASAFIIP